MTADVPDTDLVLRLTDVDDRGRSLTIQEGALRLRYRDGVDAPRLMTPGEAVVEDYVALRLSLKSHPVALLRPYLTPAAVSQG